MRMFVVQSCGEITTISSSSGRGTTASIRLVGAAVRRAEPPSSHRPMGSFAEFFSCPTPTLPHPPRPVPSPVFVGCTPTDPSSFGRRHLCARRVGLVEVGPFLSEQPPSGWFADRWLAAGARGVLGVHRRGFTVGVYQLSSHPAPTEKRTIHHRPPAKKHRRSCGAHLTACGFFDVLVSHTRASVSVVRCVHHIPFGVH